MSFRRDSAFIFGSRVVAFVLQAAGGLLAARLLGPAGRGELALLFLVPTIIAMILGFGIGTSNAYFASQAKSLYAASQPVSENRLSFPQLYYNSLWLGTLFGVAGIVAILLSEQWIIDTFMRGATPGNIRLAMLTVPLLLFYNFFQGLAQGRQRLRIFNAAVVLRPFFFLCVFVLLLLFLNDRVKAGLWAYSVGYVLPVFMLIIGLRPRPAARVPLSAAVFIAQMRIGLPSYIAELMGYLFFRVNLLLIGYFLDDVQTGYFAIVVLITESMWFVANSVGTAMLPAATGRSMEELRVLVPKAVRHVVFLTACGVLLFLAIDWFVIPLSFGKDFTPALAPLRWLYPGIVAASATKVFASYLLSQGRPHLMALIGGVGMIANVTLSIWLIPMEGVSGAALSASCSYVLMALVMGIHFVWETRVPVSTLLLFSADDFRFYREVVAQLKARIHT